MFLLNILLWVALLGSMCNTCFSKTLRALSPEMVRYINEEAKSTWRAGNNFEGLSLDEVLRQVGGLVRARHFSSLPRKRHHIARESIPETFDARTRWPECASIRAIRDQGQCGSCWAISTAAAITDRICIANNGAINPRMSTQELVTCCESCGYGCDGGYSFKAWQYYESDGLVTGGDHGSNSGCQPYTISPCTPADGRNPCYWDHLKYTPPCSKECQPNFNQTYASNKYFAKSAYELSESVEDIQADLMLYGPLTVSFDVYADLLSYKSGVYKHVTGEYEGGHVSKLIGWGVENGAPYWLIANSWNVTWGHEGFFKFLRGANECDVEQYAAGGVPRV